MEYERIELYTDELIDLLWNHQKKINNKDDKGEIVRVVKKFVADNMEFDFSNQSEYSIELKVGDMIKIPMYMDKLTYTDLYAYVAGVDCEPDIKEPHYTFIADFGKCQMNTKPTIQGYYGAKTMRLFLDEKEDQLLKIFHDNLIERTIDITHGITDDDSEDSEYDFRIDKYYPASAYLFPMSEVEIIGHRRLSFEKEIHTDNYKIFNNYLFSDLFDTGSTWLRSIDIKEPTKFCTFWGDVSGSEATEQCHIVATFSTKKFKVHPALII